MVERCGLIYYKDGVLPETLQDKRGWNIAKKYCMNNECPNGGCLNPIEDVGMDRQHFMGVPVPQECYYNLAGKIVEKHPIGVPKKPLRA